MNPTFSVKVLNITEIEEMTDRGRYLPDKLFDTLIIQAKSDIFRTLLLYKHGGIWVDTSTQSSIPLLDWLDMNSADMQSFKRGNIEQQEKNNISPWITSWFLAAPKHS